MSTYEEITYRNPSTSTLPSDSPSTVLMVTATKTLIINSGSYVGQYLPLLKNIVDTDVQTEILHRSPSTNTLPSDSPSTVLMVTATKTLIINSGSYVGQYLPHLKYILRIPSSVPIYPINDTDNLSIQISESSNRIIEFPIIDFDSLDIQISESSSIHITSRILDSDTLDIQISESSSLYGTTQHALITALYNEILVSEPSDARITSLYNETLVSEPSNTRITQLYNEILVALYRFHLYDNCQIQIVEKSSITIKTQSLDICSFQILDEHHPVLFAIYPNILPEFQPNVTLTCIGWGFLPTSIIVWNGINIPTIFISPEELQGILPSMDINMIGNVPVHILDP